jgi:hypothetical protein
LGADSQCFVVDEAARPSELPQMAGLLAIRRQLEWEGLLAQHNSIILLVYATVKGYSSWQTLRVRISCPLGLRHEISKRRGRKSAIGDIQKCQRSATPFVKVQAFNKTFITLGF